MYAQHIGMTWTVIASTILCVTCCGVTGQTTSGAGAATIYVAANGNDTWSGTQAQPYATLHAARDAVRRTPPGVPRRIVVQPGEYFLNAPLVLDAQDSGLTIEAAPGGEAVLYGGRKVTGWQADGGHLWAARLPEVADKKWDFRMLLVNGRFCKRARLPNTGYFTHQTEFAVPWMSTTGGGWKRKPTTQELTTMKYRPEDLGPWLDIRNAELTVYHMWDESVVGLASNDTSTHALTFSNPAGHPPGAFGVKKYVVWNVREGMTEPGQWYLDRSAGKVLYWPLPGEDMTKAQVIAPTIESIIALRNNGKPARDITLRGLTLSVTNTPLKAGGFGAGHFQGALSIDRSENCRIIDLAIRNVGGQGIREWSSTGLRIERCHVHHTGACGVKVGGGDVTVANCHIHHVGVTYPSAIALWSDGKAPRGVHLTHNEVHDTPYTAIACGGNNHLIDGNLIYRAMQELHDGAGIYITFCKNVILRGNFIRDITDTGGYGASAYYLDEQAEDCLVEGNLSLRVGWPSHNHMARKNTIRNNVFIADGDAQITFPKSSDYRFEKNVVVAKGKITFSNPAAMSAFANNVVFSATGKVEGKPMINYRPTTAEALNPREGSIFTDPKLTAFENGNVRFAADSPAIKLGIQPINVSQVGPRQ